MRRWIGLAVALFSIPGCGSLKVAEDSAPPIAAGDPRFDRTVQVRYLGVGGFLIRLGADVVLTAPLYSNPGLLTEAFLPIHPNPGRIEAFHPPSPADRRDVRAILVGHAHYDHLMDVPWVYRWADPAPVILGSTTTRRVLDAYARPHDSPPPAGFEAPLPIVPQDHVIALNAPEIGVLDSRQCAGEDPSPGAPRGRECAPYAGDRGRAYDVPGSKIQVRAFCARHPEQVKLIHQGPGCHAQPLGHLPDDTRDDYLEGETFVYLIDFLDGAGKPRFRIYYQDVPSDGSFGKIPLDVLQGKGVDLALLCAGNWNMVKAGDAASIVGNLRPRHVMVGHWENFFIPQDQPVEPAPLQKIGRYLSELEKRMRRLQLDEHAIVLPKPQVARNYEVQ